jgi:hypothetical protein
MSYQLYSENGFCCDLASVNGYFQMLVEVKDIPGAQALKAFLDEGKTERPKQVSLDLDYILKTQKLPISVHRTMKLLAFQMKQIKEVAIVSD